MELLRVAGGFDLRLKGRAVMSHRADSPCLFIGRGDISVEDYVTARIPLDQAKIDGNQIRLSAAGGQTVSLTIGGGTENMRLSLRCDDHSFNRLWIRLAAEPDELVWGGGAQTTFFDLRGRRHAVCSGAERSILYAQPTFLTSRRLAFHLNDTSFSALDFRHRDFHEIEVWAIPERIEFWARDNFPDLVMAMAERFGRQPPLPDWAISGAIVGFKDGDNSFARLERCLAAGAVVSGLCCEDWTGIRQTSSGIQPFWDWRWNPSRYPDLSERIKALAAEGIRFLAYVNPYLCTDGALYPEAEKQGYLVAQPPIDCGEFECGMLDLDNPQAIAWFEDQIIGRNMLELGIKGWMADGGDHAPAGNVWPVRWSAANQSAIAKKGDFDLLFFARRGGAGTQAHCPLLWTGRQGGIPAAIRAALSAGLLGNAYHHGEIGAGGPEMLQRWIEMAAFSPVMRSHEGDRPLDNPQIDDPEILEHFARMTRLHHALGPYLRKLVDEAAAGGLPLQRPLFLHFEEDRRTYDIQSEYLLGADLLVAPVLEIDRDHWNAYLPEGTRWIHLWSGRSFAGGGTVEVAAPLGQPPVFYRDGAEDAELFASLSAIL